MLPDKVQVLAALQEALTRELEALDSVAAQARDEVTSAETKQEGQYDTRATEASYLARGQAARIAEIRRMAAWADVFDASAPLRPPVVQVGAIVALEGERTEIVFIAPAGGHRLQVGTFAVNVISPSSPLGAALADLEEGDACEVDTPRGILDYEVVGLA